MKPILLKKKYPLRPIMKSDKTIIKKALMEQLNFITNLLGIKDKNIIILDVLNSKTHKEIIANLDYPAPNCPHCQGQMAKYGFLSQEKTSNRNNSQTKTN